MIDDGALGNTVIHAWFPDVPPDAQETRELCSLVWDRAASPRKRAWTFVLLILSTGHCGIISHGGRPKNPTPMPSLINKTIKTLLLKYTDPVSLPSLAGQSCHFLRTCYGHVG